MKANEKARKAAVDWAINIANDNSFHYGRSKWAHHFGCYFCGTNQKSSSAKAKAGGSYKQREKTYCCNPFVTAAYNHGAGAPSVSCTKSSGHINLANDRNIPFKNKDEWQKISKPKNVTDLVAGDVLQTPTHCMLYAGDGKVVHAAHHDNGVKNAYWNDSIKHAKISDRQWSRTSKIYRYIGKGKFEDDPDAKPVFTNGQTYTLKTNIRVRSGHGTSYPQVPYDKLTAIAKRSADSNGVLQTGTRVTCKSSWTNPEKTEVWIKIPSGWICGYQNGVAYVE